MKQRDIAAVLLLTAGLVGCDSVREKIPFLGKKKETVVSRPVTTPAPAPVDSAPQPEPAAAPAPPRRPAASLADEPWTATDTGTVNPGMTREQVVSVWGVPVAERNRETWGYLYFRNGCEVTCGTFDVVFLENGQVVDAVVRAPGHVYAGNSSSPPGRKPEATGMQLAVPATQSSEPAPAPADTPVPVDSQASRPVAPAPMPN